MVLSEFRHFLWGQKEAHVHRLSGDNQLGPSTNQGHLLSVTGLRVHWERKKRLARKMWPAIPPQARLGILKTLDVRTLFFSLCSYQLHSPFSLWSYQPNAFLMADIKKIHT